MVQRFHPFCSRERFDGSGRVAPGNRPPVRPDLPPRCVVGPAAAHLPRPVRVRRLLDLGRVSGNHYKYGPYLSPFYSPLLFGDSPHAWFGPKPGWWPGALPFSPALLILWAPGGFRFTCYYYRGAYYKAFWADPPSCAVGEPRKSYRGERSFPLILQNVHRYFLYLALVFIVLLAYDVWKALWFTDRRPGHVSFGIGVGTLVLTVNVVLLGSYTLRLPLAAPPRRRRRDEISQVAGLRRELRLHRARSTAATCCGPG